MERRRLHEMAHIHLGHTPKSRILPLEEMAGRAEVVLKGHGGAPPVYKVIRVDEDADSPSFGRLVGIRRDRDGNALDVFVDGDVRREYAGSVFPFAINKPALA
jgi:hypothetical protein